MDQNAVQDMLKSLIPFVTTYGLQVVGALVILFLGKFAAGFADSAVRKVLGKAKTDPVLAGFLANLVRYAILAFTVIAALSKFGIQTTSFIAVLGAAGLAVGLALQGSLSNFAAGVLLLIFRPFSLDDWVSAGGATGKVVEIGIFTTTLHTGDNQKVIIPNSGVMGGNITNVNANPTRRVDLTAGISYGDDIGKAKEVLEKLLADHPKVLADPAPKVAVVALADSSVNFVVRPWVNTADYWDVYFEVTRAIKEELDKAGISIPFPQRDVHMHQVAN
ncbi:MAG TPA: mechanosensitive ion channel domain-containing protein [Deferrisomatales bacterium]|nr:mechanosensitive ion channel domain-containing protein [Deferrisomatales bacterium]